MNTILLVPVPFIQLGGGESRLPRYQLENFVVPFFALLIVAP